MSKTTCLVCNRETSDGNYCEFCGAALPRVKRAAKTAEEKTVTIQVHSNIDKLGALLEKAIQQKQALEATLAQIADFELEIDVK